MRVIALAIMAAAALIANGIFDTWGDPESVDRHGWNFTSLGLCVLTIWAVVQGW
jgi:hypothetical protein